MRSLILQIWMLIYIIKLNIEEKFTFSGKKKIQNRHLKKVLKKAAKTDFYKEKWSDVSYKDVTCVDDLTKLPIIEKEDIIKWVEKAEKENPDKLSKYINIKTSGSTGKPMSIYWSVKEKAYSNALWMLILMKKGYSPIKHSIMGIKIVSKESEKKQKDSFIQKIGIGRRTVYSVLRPVNELVDILNSEQPDLLYANKSTLLKIAQYAGTNDITLFQPKWICSTSEQLEDNSLTIIKDYFKGFIWTEYGAEEIGGCAATLEGNHKWEINLQSLAVWAETDGKKSSNGSAVLTSLYHHVFPLINYRIGDYIEMNINQNDDTYQIEDIVGRYEVRFRMESGGGLRIPAFLLCC